ncbi:ComF family protein [Gammaproteobacteria bacterium AH-315-C21]|nr:ComF family protein [Gammaproteobacteria bacterium AH-315-C21]
MKFGQRLYYGRFLGDALAKTVSQDERLIIPDLIIPVPLHRKRLNERGYNQAYEIARPTAKLLQCPVTDRFVVRSSETKQQSQLNALQRRRNLKNVFIVLGAVKGLHVAIVDDVMTTGATVGELTRALIQAGARRIDIWLAARAPLGGN